MSNKVLHSHLIAISTVVLFSVTACYSIIFTSGIILYGDFTLPSNLQRFFDMHYPLWNQYGSVDSFQFIPRLAFRAIPILAAIHFGFPADLFYKLVVVGTIVLSGLSMYFSFFYLFFPSKDEKKLCAGAIAASVVYMLNFKAIHAIIWPTLQFTYAIAPFTLFSIFKLTSTLKFKYAFLFVILMTLTAASPHYLFFISILTVLWLIYYSAIAKFRNISLKFMKVILLSFLVFVLTNTYWILPFVYSGSFEEVRPSYVLSTENLDLLSRNSQISNTFRLVDIWWQHSALMPDGQIFQSIWIVSSFFVPIIAFSALIASRNQYRKYAIFFGLISIIIVLISTGANGLLRPIYQWFTLNTSFGWVMRAPNKLTMLLAPMYSFLCGMTLISVFCEVRRKKLIMFILLATVFGVSVAPMINGYLYNVFVPVTIPDEYHEANAFISGDAYKVLWLPPRYTDEISWAPGKLVGYFDVRSSSMPTIGSFSLCSRNFLSYIFKSMLGNRTDDLGKLLSVLNVKYVIFHNDTSTYNEYPINELLENQESLESAANLGFIHIFENRDYANVLSLPEETIFVTTGLEKFISLASFEPFNPVKYSLVFPWGDSEHLQYSNLIVADSTSCNDLVIEEIDEGFVIAPFTNVIHVNPERFWSRDLASDTISGSWHYHLEKRSIENWQFDYGKGLVFTWATSRPREDATPSDKELIRQWVFNSTINLDEWKNHTYEKQFGAIHNLTLDNNSLKAELWNSTWGWKTINSPLIPAEYDSWYRLELQIKGENAHKTHIKIFEYDAGKEIVNGRQVESVGSGNFDWNSISVDFKPESPEIEYFQLQIWHGHETEQPLPNIIRIDNVKVYNLQRFMETVTLEIPVQIQETDNYILLTRFFQNQQGGRIQVQLDNASYTINTRDQLNRFTWKEIDTLNLERGKHTITVTNHEGFNAINLFILIPKQEYQSAQNQLEQNLQDKRIIHILEAETDLYHENTTTSNKYGGEASNGQIQILSQNSTIWQNLTVAKTDKYKLALRSRGQLQIQIHNQTYMANSTRLGWNYLNITLLNKGNQKIQITTPTTAELDVIWLYSTQNSSETPQDIFTLEQKPAEIINYTRINPTKYTININATQPFILSFAETYDPFWIVHVDGERTRSIPLYSVINGFWINRTKELEITVEYEPQKWFNYGSIISATTFLACTAYSAYNWTKNKAIWKRTKTTPSNKPSRGKFDKPPT